MKEMLLQDVNTLYSNASECKIYRRVVNNSTFEIFSKAIGNLEYSLQEKREDDFWKSFLREIKRYRYLRYVTPLPFVTQTEHLLPYLEKCSSQCKYSYPDFFAQIMVIRTNLIALSEVNENPILDLILEITQDQGNTAFLQREASFRSDTADLFSNYSSLNLLQIVNLYQLRNTPSYDQLIALGPSRWYPEHILRAPRASKIYLIRYNWISDTWKPQPIFHQTFVSTFQKPIITEQIHDQKDNIEYNSYSEPDEIPEINWGQISKKIIRQAVDDRNQDFTSCKLYLLANEHTVFLEANENTKVFVLNLEINSDEDDEDEDQPIKRTTLSKIHPGMFLLLRTEGGGDYISEVADKKILREQAKLVRGMQEQWKERLRSLVALKGLFSVSIELLDQGSERANEINVRNWMSSKNIRPAYDRDFGAILKLIGLQDKEKEYQEAAKQIDRAHFQAGMLIRKMLLAQVAKANFHELHQKGVMDFELSGVDGGSLTAFRIEQISPSTFEIPASRVGHPSLVKDLSWLE